MKTVLVPTESADVATLLDQARDEDLLVRTADGARFLITAVDDFDEEIIRTQRNERLMQFLEERARQPATIALSDVRKQLGLEE